MLHHSVVFEHTMEPRKGFALMLDVLEYHIRNDEIEISGRKRQLGIGGNFFQNAAPIKRMGAKRSKVRSRVTDFNPVSLEPRFPQHLDEHPASTPVI